MLSQGTKEQINRNAPTRTLLRLAQNELSVIHRQMTVRRNHVNMIWPYPDLFGHLNDRHLRGPLKNFGKIALVLRRQMHHDDEAKAAFVRQAVINSWMAFKPPADAPIPTTEIGSSLLRISIGRFGRSVASFGRLPLRDGAGCWKVPQTYRQRSPGLSLAMPSHSTREFSYAIGANARRSNLGNFLRRQCVREPIADKLPIAFIQLA